MDLQVEEFDKRNVELVPDKLAPSLLISQLVIGNACIKRRILFLYLVIIMLLFLESKVVPSFAIVFTMAYLSAAIYCYNDY